MNNSVIRLYPLPNQKRPPKGLYFEHYLCQYNQSSGEAFVYGNFITSLDGHIASPQPARPGFIVPKNTANDRDWCLFKELSAQADIIISSGLYLHDSFLSRTTVQAVLMTDDHSQ